MENLNEGSRTQKVCIFGAETTTLPPIAWDKFWRPGLFTVDVQVFGHGPNQKPEVRNVERQSELPAGYGILSLSPRYAKQSLFICGPWCSKIDLSYLLRGTKTIHIQLNFLLWEDDWNLRYHLNNFGASNSFIYSRGLKADTEMQSDFAKVQISPIWLHSVM